MFGQPLVRIDSLAFVILSIGAYGLEVALCILLDSARGKYLRKTDEGGMLWVLQNS